MDILDVYHHKTSIDLLGDDFGDIDCGGRGSGVKSHSRGRGGESSNGGDGELHFDDVGVVLGW